MNNGVLVASTVFVLDCVARDTMLLGNGCMLVTFVAFEVDGGVPIA